MRSRFNTRRFERAQKNGQKGKTWHPRPDLEAFRQFRQILCRQSTRRWMAILLMAMGFDVLSMNSTNLLIVKQALRSFELARAKRILNKILKMDNAVLIRDYVEAQMRKAGLGQIIRNRIVG